MRKILCLIMLLFVAQGVYAQANSTQRQRFYENNFTEIAKGNVTGKVAVFQYGNNGDVAAADEMIWDNSSAYVYMTRAQQIGLLSGDAEDDTSGTGARTVKIYGLSNLYNDTTETVTLAGSDTAWTTKSFIRVYKAKVITAGSGGVNAAQVKIGDANVDTTLALIATGENISKSAMFTVPTGKTFYLVGIVMSSAATKNNEINIMTRPPSEVFSQFDSFDLYQNMKTVIYPLVKSFSDSTDIEIRCNTVGGSGDVSVSFWGWYE